MLDRAPDRLQLTKGNSNPCLRSERTSASMTCSGYGLARRTTPPHLVAAEQRYLAPNWSGGHIARSSVRSVCGNAHHGLRACFRLANQK